VDVNVRCGVPADYAFVLDLGRRTVSSSVSKVRVCEPEELQKGYERLLAFIRENSHVLLIAESSVEKLGFLVLLDEVPDEVSGARQAFIAYMAVEEHARRHGTAAALLAQAEQVARSRGLPAIALMVTEGNEAGRSFYAREGFVTERRLLVKPLLAEFPTYVPER
jgi:GNAT superfamily N-acetyltransferase